VDRGRGVGLPAGVAEEGILVVDVGKASSRLLKEVK
jgi:hypothetical protein